MPLSEAHSVNPFHWGKFFFAAPLLNSSDEKSDKDTMDQTVCDLEFDERSQGTKRHDPSAKSE